MASFKKIHCWSDVQEGDVSSSVLLNPLVAVFYGNSHSALDVDQCRDCGAEQKEINPRREIIGLVVAAMVGSLSSHFSFCPALPFPIFRFRDRKINSCSQRRYWDQRGSQRSFICIYNHPPLTRLSSRFWSRLSSGCGCCWCFIAEKGSPAENDDERAGTRNCSNIYSEMGFASPTPLFKSATKQKAIRNHN